jgi:serralysin
MNEIWNLGATRRRGRTIAALLISSLIQVFLISIYVLNFALPNLLTATPLISLFSKATVTTQNIMSNLTLDTNYEILAKGIYSYFAKDDILQQVAISAFKDRGYIIDRVFQDPTTSLAALGFRSQDGSKPPVLVFQGTNDLDDLIADFDAKGIGFEQFFGNKQTIQDWLGSIASNTELNPQGLKPDVTGQSLGGALTQWTASELPQLIGSAVSFESPGIASNAIDKFTANGGDPKQVTHYITDGDVVSLSGAAFLPGRVVVSTFKAPIEGQNGFNINFSRKHLAGVLADLPSFIPNPGNAVFGLPADRTLSEISVAELNRPDFTYKGEDWNTAIGLIRANNPNLAKGLSSRANSQAARANGDYSGIIIPAIGAGIAGADRNAPGLFTQPTIGNDILFGTNKKDAIGGLAGNDYIRGGTGNDRLEGNGGDDALLGGWGNDILVGGSGNDILTGGKGADLFLFDANAPFTTAALGVDLITDFRPGVDKIGLGKSTFTALGQDLSQNFAIVADNLAAETIGAAIVYNSSNGKLFYNPNGCDSGFGEGGQFATLFDRPTLGADNFRIV